MGGSTRATDAQILVGPNILVSRDGDFPHAESTLAANPTSPKNLIAASMTLSKSDGGWGRSRIYSSQDGGNTWIDGTIPLYAGDFGRPTTDDPQLAFDPEGTAYFADTGDELSQDSKVHNRMALYVYRSENGGKTWLPPTRLPGCDHPQMVVDNTYSRFRGRVYIWAAIHANTLGLYRSIDGGKTFTGPTEVVHPQMGGGNTSPPVILSDGTLLLPYYEYLSNSETGGPTRPIKLVASKDGGITFSAPHDVGLMHVPADGEDVYLKQRLTLNSSDRTGPRLGGIFDWPGEPPYAVSPAGSRFPDRIYAVWGDTGSGNSRVFLSYSRDRGVTWSPPRELDANVPTNSYQLMPQVAVNKHGVVGIEWLDTRRSKEQDFYDVYFTASLDGGESFLPGKCITSRPSFPLSTRNITPYPVGTTTKADLIELTLDSVFFSRSVGQDYMGLAIDADGTFHGLWSDNRKGSNGNFQLWTAAVRVQETAESEVQALPRQNKLNLQDIDFILDPIQYNIERHQVVLPVRIHNRTDHELHSPLAVVIKSIEISSYLRSAGFIAPKILNAFNKKSGEGAVIDYSHALGDSNALRSGDVSEAVPWLLEIDEPGQTLFDIKAEVTHTLE